MYRDRIVEDCCIDEDEIRKSRTQEDIVPGLKQRNRMKELDIISSLMTVHYGERVAVFSSKVNANNSVDVRARVALVRQFYRARAIRVAEQRLEHRELSPDNDDISSDDVCLIDEEWHHVGTHGEEHKYGEIDTLSFHQALRQQKIEENKEDAEVETDIVRLYYQGDSDKRAKSVFSITCLPNFMAQRRTYRQRISIPMNSIQTRRRIYIRSAGAPSIRHVSQTETESERASERASERERKREREKERTLLLTFQDLGWV